MLGGYQALTATLLAIAALELAISAKLPTGGIGLFRTSLTHRASQRRLVPPRFQVLPAKTSC